MEDTNDVVIKKKTPKNSCTTLRYMSLSELISVTIFTDRDLGGAGCEPGGFALFSQIYTHAVFARSGCFEDTPNSTRSHNFNSQCFFA